MSFAVAASTSGSFTSSPISSCAASLFSLSSFSTDASSLDADAQPLHFAPPPPALNPQQKALSIRLPLHLPLPPDEPVEVDTSALIVNDELEGAPVGFAVGKLRSLGASLLKTTSATCLHIPPGPTLPAYLRCTPPDIAPESSPVLLPSHVLAIRSNDSPRTLLLPVHGLLWASSSSALALLSSRPEKQPAHPSLPSAPRPTLSAEDEAQGAAYLPVVELNLPSSAAFPLLQGWVYLRSPQLLLSSLLPQPSSSGSSPPPAPPTLSHLLNPAPPSPTSASLPSPTSLTQSLARAVPSQTLLSHVHLVHSLWQDAVALQIGDEDLWKVMGAAWQILVAALALRERERRARTTPPSSDEE
ncbi:hypothetical protein JCM10207_005775 [Rhodosporidiobolus poonsookiae]